MDRVSAGAGHSAAGDGQTAGRDATADAVEAAGGSASVVYVFASSEYDPRAVLNGVNEATEATIVGTTTAGEIVNTGSYTESVAVLALGGDGIRVGVGSDEFGNDYRAAGRAAVGGALGNLDADGTATNVLDRDGTGWQAFPKTVGTVFADYAAPENEVMRGIDECTRPMTVHGGLAADDWKYDGSARIFHDDALVERGMVVAAMDLDVRTGLSVRHGYHTTDLSYEVTAVDGATVLELDGEPAFQVYEDEFGPQVRSDQFRLTRPFGISVGDDERRIHVPHAIHEETGAMEFTGGDLLSVGDRLTVMDPTGQDVIAGAESAIQEALGRAGDPDPDDVEAVMIHDCLCRWFFLSDRETREQELDVLRSHVGEETPIVGWYTAGELALPDTLAGTYNQTAVVWVVTSDSL